MATNLSHGSLTVHFLRYPIANIDEFNRKMYCVGLINQGRFIVLFRHWVLNPTNGFITRIFLSVNKSAVANFDIPVLEYFNREADACYLALIFETFGKYGLLDFGSFVFNYSIQFHLFRK